MPQNTAEFDRLYAMLNREQKAAVDATEGPVMVIAGPGTGKTQILTLRIANILRKSDVPADAILALTFTNAAAANMRKRLVSIIGSDAYRVSIFTFHSFANHLIEHHPERFSTIVGRSNCSEVERIEIVRALLDTGIFEILRPLGDPYFHVQNIIAAIGHLKREGITPQAFSKWLEDTKRDIEGREDLMHAKGAYAGKMKSVYVKELQSLEKNEELALLYKQYQDALASKKRYDFEDSLLLLIEAMEKSEDFLRELQETYQYFLVDEHQDTNGAQNRILELLASFFDTPNLFVVGDEKQAVFRFQGASLANFLYFEKKFQDVTRVTLSKNYRSHQSILDASHTLIEMNKGGINAPLTAHVKDTDSKTKIHVYSFDADDEELLYLAESIRGMIDSGVPAHEIAVLYRNNRDVDAIADYFERINIPFLIESGHGVLDDPDIRKLNFLLRTLANLEDNDALAKALFIDFLAIPIEDVYIILHETSTSKKSLYTTLQQRASLSLKDPDAVASLVSKLSRWKRLAENENFLHTFESVVKESGILEHIQASSFHTEKFDKLVRLFDEVKSHVKRQPFFSIEDYVSFLRILDEHAVTLEAKSRQVPNSVRLMTAHKAKGLEFDNVFIVHAYDGHWGGKLKREYFKLPYRSGAHMSTEHDVEDERRLFYVAITRARKNVYISYAALAPDGRDRVPTQFIEEIHDDLKVKKDGAMLGYAGKRPPLFVDRKGRKGKEKYLEFVKASFAERGLSATAVNNFLTCPWKWFYENFFHTQFVPTLSQQKGTVAHKALEEFFTARNKQKNLSVDTLLHLFNKHLEELDLAPNDAARISKDMTQALTGWYKARQGQWEDMTKSEVHIKGVLLDNSIRLTGKLDKLECLDDKCHAVRVIDYKTGKPKSRNEIEGKTMSAQNKKGSGGYKRQLVFYKLLLDMYAEKQYDMQEGVLDFIEPNASGQYKQEAFKIEAAEVSELKDTIRTIAQEIQTLSFWDERCDDPACEACALRELMEKD